MNQDQDNEAVDLMAKLMKHELAANSERKGSREGWLQLDPMGHLLQIYYHTAKLQVALKALQMLGKDKDASSKELEFRREQVKEYAADVGNHAMMVLDTLTLLGLPPLKKKEAPQPKAGVDIWTKSLANGS